MDTKLKEAVTAAKNGDRNAFEALYSGYRDKLFFFAVKYTGSREAAEDVVSETFITAMEKLPSLRDGEAFGGWLYSICYNKCMDHCKADSARVSLDDEGVDAVIQSPVMLPEDYAVSEELKAGLRDIIDSLSPEARAAVIMYYYEEMNISEVAAAAGISENAAKQRLFRARNTIRSRIESLVGKGAVFAAVPLGAVLNNTAELGEAAAPAAGAAAASGTAKLAGAGFAVKAAAVGAAAVIAVGIPIGLGKLSQNGDARIDDSSSVERLADDSRADSRSDDSSERVISNRSGGRCYALLGNVQTELDPAKTRQFIGGLTPAAENTDIIFFEEGKDWLVSCEQEDEALRFARVASDKGWYIVDGHYNVYEDSAELSEYVVAQVIAHEQALPTKETGLALECSEPSTETEYADTAREYIGRWLDSLKSEDTDSSRRIKDHNIVTEDGLLNYLASGMVKGEKQFLVELCIELEPEDESGFWKRYYQEGRYTAGGKFWSGYYLCCKFSYKDGKCTLIDYGTRDDYESLKTGLNGIASGGYKNFYEFARRDDLTDAIEKSFVPYGRVTVSRNLTQTMDGTPINIDIYTSRTDSHTEDSYTAIWDKRAYINGKATYSTGLYFTDNGTGHVPDTLPKDFRLTFDNYDGDGNPDFCCRYDADDNGTFYVLESIQTDGRIFNYSGRAYSGGIYVAGCTDPSPRLQKNDDHKYIGWKVENGRYYPTDEAGSEITLPEINMYSDRYYLPDELRYYSADENKVTCFVWNNTAEPITTDGSYSIERFDGSSWVTEAEGLTVPAVTVPPRECAEVTYDISALKNRYATTYRIVQKSGQFTGYGSFICEGGAVSSVSITAKPVVSGAHTGTFTVTDTGIEKEKITSVSILTDDGETPLMLDNDLGSDAEYSYAGSLPDKPGTYTLTVNGSYQTTLTVAAPELAGISVDISKELKEENLLLTVTPSRDCTVGEVYAVKQGSSMPILFGSNTDTGRVSAGETRSLELINGYAELYLSGDGLDSLYKHYDSEDTRQMFSRQYVIEPGLSEEEFKSRITELFTLSDTDDYKLVVNLDIDGADVICIVD
ncbi:MAG: RNA polymerase sigma factor [Ruminococcus sp.]|nr:RNA polymerase sigma factor [Ruminococcus sp.]